MTRSAWVRIVPFAVFMLFVGVGQVAQWGVDNGFGGLAETHLLFLYPIKIIVVTFILFYFRRHYPELRLRDLQQVGDTLLSIACGILVFVLWINMDWPFATFGEGQGFNPTLVDHDLTRHFLILFRVAGAAVLVPVMEEIFWRSFLLRYIIDSDFEKIRIGTYTLTSFAIGAVLFGLEHNLILAGIMAGAAYSLLLYKTKSLNQCVLAHGVTNMALGVYVLMTQSWQFW